MSTEQERIFEGQQLKAFRKKEGISQKQLASETGRFQSEISNYEKGLYAVPTDLVKHLHIKYKMSYKWYYHREGRMKDNEYIKPTLVTDIAAIKEDNRILQEKVKAMERDIKYLASRIK